MGLASFGECDMHCAGDIVMCMCHINGHIGRHIDGFNGGYGVGQINFEGRRRREVIIVLTGEGIMCVKYMV